MTTNQTTQTPNQQGMLAKQAAKAPAKKHNLTPREKADALLTPVMSTIKDALPKGWDAERFKTMATVAAGANPKLLECQPASFVRAALQAAQAGVEPNTPAGQAYLIPYNGQVQFQLSYKGLIQLAYRSGQISIIDCQTVHKNDEFIYELGTDPKLIHKPYMEGDRGEAIAYYAVFKTKNGGTSFRVMSKPEVRSFAQKKSTNFSGGPWHTDFDAMAEKTVLKKLLKTAPVSTEYMQAAAADEHVFKGAEIKDSADANFFEYEDADYTIVEDTGEVVEDAQG